MSRLGDDMEYQCHLCNSPVEPVINLGVQPLANALLSSPDEKDEYTYTAIWAWCRQCQLLQLVDVPPAEIVYTSSYPYRSGLSKFMDEHFEKTARYLEERYSPRTAIEVAVND